MRKQRERDRARHAAQTVGERQDTSQQRSTREHERMAAETPEERERRLQQLPKCITRRILYHIATVNYHSILCKIILVQHVNYSDRTCKFSENLYTTGVPLCSFNEMRTK